MKWLLLILFLPVLIFPFGVKAAAAITITDIPDSLIAGSTTTVTVSATGLNANEAYNIKIRLGTSLGELTKGETSNPLNTAPDDWLSDTSAWAKFPVVTANASGAWSGTFQARASTNSTAGSNLVLVRFHHSSGTNIDSASQSINVIPAPTATPTPMPTATNTPGPTNTPTPVPTAIPTSTPRPSSTPRATATPRVSPSPTGVPVVPSIGEQEFVQANLNGEGSKLLDLNQQEDDFITPTPLVLGESTAQPNSNLGPILLIVGGVVGLSVSLILLFRRARSEDILS
jgi:hypothetical protein